MPTLTPRQAALPLALAAALAFSACGSDEASTDNLPNDADIEKLKDSSSELEKSSGELKEQGEDLQKQAGDLQTFVTETQKKVTDGALSQEEADKLIEERTDKLREDANTTASDALDTLEGVEGLPDEAKKALEDARKQIPTP